MDCGPSCLRIIARHYGRYFELEELRQLTHITTEGVSLLNLAEAAEKIGFITEGIACDWDNLSEDINLPCIAVWGDDHYVVIYKVTTNKVYVVDPAIGKIEHTRKEFLSRWLTYNLPGDEDPGKKGVLLLIEPTADFDMNEHGGSREKETGWKIVLPFLKPYYRYLGQLLISIFVVGIVQLIFPFLAQAVVDQGIRNNDLNLIYTLLIAQCVLLISQSIGEVIRSYLLLYVGNRVNISMLSVFMQRLMLLPQRFFERRNVGDLLQRINDNARIEEFFTAQSLNVLFSAFSIVIFSAVLIWYDLLIFLIFAGGASLYFIWIWSLAKKREKLEYKRFTASANQQSQVQDLLFGMPEIRLNGSEQRRRWKWEKVKITQHQIAVKTLSLDQLQSRGGMFIHELKNIIVTFVTAVMVTKGEMTLGMLIAIQYILGQMNAPLLSLIEFMRSAQDAKISLKRLDEVHKEIISPDTISNPVIKPTGDIRIENVSFKYGGTSSPSILNNINICIPKNKVTAIVGASGSGKTTLLKVLLKFYHPTQGKIVVGKQDLKHMSYQTWLSQCGVVMQDGYLFSDTVLANITESDSRKPLDKNKLKHAIHIAHLADFISSLPKGLATKIGRDGIAISGGEKQRILIARAVYKDPAFLFFDEATSALDAISEKYIVNNLENFFHDRTVIIVAHRLSTVRHADQILAVRDGQVVEVGNHSQLLELGGYYFNLVKNQLEL
jgi:ATP-binding cassette subfamily B protein